MPSPRRSFVSSPTDTPKVNYTLNLGLNWEGNKTYESRGPAVDALVFSELEVRLGEGVPNSNVEVTARLAQD